MPRRRISNWHYVYVLQSEKDKDFYIGYTQNLRKRLKEHSAKMIFSTKSRFPCRPIYVEACLNKADVQRRGEYLKTSQGHRFLKIRLKEFLN